jgi:adenylyltransferase and sulfurtransferase
LGSVIYLCPFVRPPRPLPDSHPRFEHSSPFESIDVPLYNLVANPSDYVSSEFETYVVCRLGNDSQIAADALRSTRPDPTFVIKDLVGGLRAWSRDADPGFPVY